ncbi:MAG: amino acid ABC transporter substrate-binding protein, partial [Clostridia bacterium]|nr:amino acid ABC transporter substrate-binding protein [Clostridia bacterium]
MKKYLSILLAAVLLISMLAFSGCTKSNDEDVDYILKKNTLVVGVIDAPPLTVINDEGEWSGFAADLLRSFG